MGRIEFVRCQLSDGRVESVGPPLRFQDGFSVVPVKVEGRIHQGLVRLRVRLGADERVVQTHANLFEQPVSKIVDGEDGGGVGGREIGSVCFLQCQFQLEFALTQIDKVRLRIDLKVHGGDARGERMNGYFSPLEDAQICRWDLEEIQCGIDNGRRPGDDGGRTHDVVSRRLSCRMVTVPVPCLFLTLASSSARRRLSASFETFL